MFFMKTIIIKEVNFCYYLNLYVIFSTVFDVTVKSKIYTEEFCANKFIIKLIVLSILVRKNPCKKVAFFSNTFKCFPNISKTISFIMEKILYILSI